MTDVRLQPLTRARVAQLGQAGARWRDALPGVLAALEQSWGITLDRPLPGGSSAYVTRARRPDGSEVVVKVGIDAGETGAQAAVLRRAAGRGFVQLLAVDATRGALLLEALGSSLERSARPPLDQLSILAETLALAWSPPEPGSEPTDRAGDLARLIERAWSRQQRPCSIAVVDSALAMAGRLATVDPADRVQVHGDPHPGNLLAATARRGAETGYCFVDPDGFVAERAYDLGVALRDWSSTLLLEDHPRRTAEGYCRRLADRTGVDARRIWQWGFLERVATGLYLLDTVGAPALAERFLRSAELLLTPGDLANS